MGEVWRAEDTKLGRQVALKVLPEEMAADRERLERFQREASSVAALNHPNIVTIYSVAEDRGVHFLEMELIEGESLDELLRSGSLELGRFFKLAIQIADALAAAHAASITHRGARAEQGGEGQGGRRRAATGSCPGAHAQRGAGKGRR